MNMISVCRNNNLWWFEDRELIFMREIRIRILLLFF